MALNRIGIALSNQNNLHDLLELIVREARQITRADAGSIYIKEGSKLHFRVSQNQTIETRRSAGGDQPRFKGFSMEISRHSIAGYVASTGETLNIPDVYHLPADVEYSFNKDYDRDNDYRTQSMLQVPMKDPAGEIIGVLQLINALDAQVRVMVFAPDQEALVQSLASQAAVCIRNNRLTLKLKKAYLDTIHRLAIAAEYRDEDTAAHIMRMSNYSAVIARCMGMPAEDVEIIKYASPMHDVGKIGISDKILLKPGKLTDEEFLEMKRHTIIGGKILTGGDSEPLITSEIIALTHHEKFDGSGYPRGLKGEEIPLSGRVVALADVFDALTTKRCYKEAFPVEKARAIIDEGSGKHFDPGVVDCFHGCVDEILEIKHTYSD